MRQQGTLKLTAVADFPIGINITSATLAVQACSRHTLAQGDVINQYGIGSCYRRH